MVMDKRVLTREREAIGLNACSVKNLMMLMEAPKRFINHIKGIFIKVILLYKIAEVKQSPDSLNNLGWYETSDSRQINLVQGQK
jgi:hypothetical protein